jgi:nucleoside-diphosphate-sugar epimerase
VKGDVVTTSILVMGGTGTLGRPVARRLRDGGASVTVLSRHPRETTEGIRYTAGDLSTGEGIGVSDDQNGGLACSDAPPADRPMTRDNATTKRRK